MVGSTGLAIAVPLAFFPLARAVFSVHCRLLLSNGCPAEGSSLLRAALWQRVKGKGRRAETGPSTVPPKGKWPPVLPPPGGRPGGRMGRSPCRSEGCILGVAATRSRAPPFRGNCAAARGRVRRCKCPPRPHTRLAAGGVEFGDAEVPAGRRVFLCPEIAGVHLGVDEWLLSQSAEWNERVAGEGGCISPNGRCRSPSPVLQRGRRPP